MYGADFGGMAKMYARMNYVEYAKVSYFQASSRTGSSFHFHRTGANIRFCQNFQKSAWNRDIVGLLRRRTRTQVVPPRSASVDWMHIIKTV